MSLQHILIFDEHAGEGVDIDFIEKPDGSREILCVDKIYEGDL
jgi:hypothetical protein